MKEWFIVAYLTLLWFYFTWKLVQFENMYDRVSRIDRRVEALFDDMLVDKED